MNMHAYTLNMQENILKYDHDRFAVCHRVSNNSSEWKINRSGFWDSMVVDVFTPQSPFFILKQPITLKYLESRT